MRARAPRPKAIVYMSNRRQKQVSDVMKLAQCRGLQDRPARKRHDLRGAHGSHGNLRSARTVKMDEILESIHTHLLQRSLQPGVMPRQDDEEARRTGALFYPPGPRGSIKFPPSAATCRRITAGVCAGSTTAVHACLVTRPGEVVLCATGRARGKVHGHGELRDKE